MGAKTDQFHDAMNHLADEVGRWHKLLNDPFKAPELKVGLPPSVTAAAWDAGIAWHVLTTTAGGGE